MISVVECWFCSYGLLFVGCVITVDRYLVFLNFIFFVGMMGMIIFWGGVGFLCLVIVSICSKFCFRGRIEERKEFRLRLVRRFC